MLQSYDLSVIEFPDNGYQEQRDQSIVRYKFGSCEKVLRAFSLLI